MGGAVRRAPAMRAVRAMGGAGGAASAAVRPTLLTVVVVAPVPRAAGSMASVAVHLALAVILGPLFLLTIPSDVSAAMCARVVAVLVLVLTRLRSPLLLRLFAPSSANGWSSRVARHQRTTG